MQITTVSILIKKSRSSVGIIIVFPKTYMISSIVPIKNKVETVNELSTQLRKKG